MRKKCSHDFHFPCNRVPSSPKLAPHLDLNLNSSNTEEMNPNEMEDNGGGRHPHGHHDPPPDHHGHPQYYDPQQYPNYGSYPNYPYAYYHHHEGAPPPPHPHQYHDGYYPHPYHYDPNYGMGPPPHGVKADPEQYYQGPPPHHMQESYRMDDHGQERHVQMQETMPPRDKVLEPRAEHVAEQQPVKTPDDEVVKDMQVDTVAEAVHVPARDDTEEPDALKEEAHADQDHEVHAQSEAQVAAANDEAQDLPQGKVFPFEDVLNELHSFKSQYGHASIPVNHPAFAKIIGVLMDNDIEKEADNQWERQFNVLKEYKDKYGNCDIPHTDPKMGKWMELHRKLKADGASDPLIVSRLAKLDQIGFEWDLPVWDKRLQELTEYTNEHTHTDVPINHPGGLGVWVINQKFNLHEMPKERIAALDALGFIWNHNRKRRNNKMWDQRYAELVEYVEKHKTANVPTTAGHSKLSKWVGK
jgi:hypothetical protein